MARPSLNNVWRASTINYNNTTYKAYAAGPNPFIGTLIPENLLPKKITAVTLTSVKDDNNPIVSIHFGPWIGDGSNMLNYRWAAAIPVAENGIYKINFPHNSLLAIQQDLKNCETLGFVSYYWPNSNIQAGSFEATLDYTYEGQRDIIAGAIVSRSDPANKTLQVKINFLGETEENKEHYEKTYHVAKIAGTNYTAEGEGSTITFAGIDAPIPNTVQIGIDLYRYTKSPDPELFALMQTGKMVQVSIAPTPPEIVSLEPDNIDTNITQAAIISWSTINQSTFKLFVNGREYVSGTTQKQIIVPENTLKKGNNTLSLTVEYIGIVVGVATKTVTFRGYGKPNKPVFEDRNIYNTALPRFRWTTDEQNIYHFQILQGSTTVIDTGEILSSEQEYVVTSNLSNDTTYTIRVRVKNAQGLYSDWTQKEIQISYHQLDAPELSLYKTGDNLVTVNVTNAEDVRFSHCEVYKKTDYTDWQKIAINGPLNTAFTDFQLASGVTYHYKAINYNTSGGATESEIKSITVNLKTSSFLDLDTMQEIRGSYSNSDAGLTVQRVQDKQILKYEGLRAPVTEKGETDYSILNFNAIFRNPGEYRKFVNDAENAEVILYRDAHGHYYYCQLTAWGDEVTHPGGVVRHPFVFTEVNFLEGVIYDGGGKMQIIKLDQGYKLDRGYVLDGIYYPPN